MITIGHLPRRGVKLLSRGAWLAVLLGLAAPVARAQEQLPPPGGASLGVPVEAAAVRALTLPECIALGLERQPAVAAARATLVAAQTNQRAVDGLCLARLIARDIPIRQKQSALGVDIAAAALFQIEWDTRYFITRTYFTVLYAREQGKVASEAIKKLQVQLDNVKQLLEGKQAKVKVSETDPEKIQVQIGLLKVRQAEAAVGEEKALAALREAMGVAGDCSIVIADGTLPGLIAGLDRCQLVALGVARRGEMGEAANAQQVTFLEIEAQGKSFMPIVRTFAAASDIHARSIPQGISNTEYRPGAFGIEMPVFMVGHRKDRMDRARDFDVRASAVVDKTHQLITLEVEALYLKWKEADQQVRALDANRQQVQVLSRRVADGFGLGLESAEDNLRTNLLQNDVLAQYNEALFHHAVALAGLERATAGGYVPPWAVVVHP